MNSINNQKIKKGKKGIKWTPEVINKLKYYKQKGFLNREIAVKMDFSHSAIDNACYIFRILLNERARKYNKIKGSKIAGSIQSIKSRERGKLKKFDENLGYILGVLFGDGSTWDLGERGGIELRTTNKSFALVFYNAILNYTKEKPKYHVRTYTKHFKKENRVYKNVIYYEVFYNSVYFVRNIIKLFGKTTTKEWRISSSLYLSLGNKFCKSFIRGLFDSEGSFYICKNRVKGTLEFSTTNKNGVECLALLLSKMGFVLNINKIRRKGFYEYKLRAHRVEIIKKFYSEIGFSIDYKQQKLKAFMELLNK
ncbi:MAG: hypothetical protein JXA99_08700 [Candidatus Lokiarchaeota archaeon]|nr:hypothetical protein [Candidatus Lokiarchaeota archaeon]